MWYTCPCCDGVGYLVGNLVTVKEHTYFEAIKCNACGGKGQQWVFVYPNYPTTTPPVPPYWAYALPTWVANNVG